MPVLRDSRGLPAWSELDSFEIVDVPRGADWRWGANEPANKIVVVDGAIAAHLGGAEHVLAAGAVLDAPAGRHRLHSDDGARVVVMSGRWGEDCGGSGVFAVTEVDNPRDVGDPVDYPKRTAFDRHYHDCDEYWIIVAGRGTAVTEGVQYQIAAGDCVATRMGVHHDLPLAPEPIRGVYVETTLGGRRRLGHLWEHTHGPATAIEQVASTQ
jgi:mannose-6-phosphate isomerase-like protein (cupin superfamily)